MEQAPVERAEMELADDQGHVRPAVELEIGDVGPVQVVANHVTITGGGRGGAGVDPGEAAAQVELAGSDGFDRVADRPEVLLRGSGVEGFEIPARPVLVGGLAAFDQRLPRSVMGTPGLVESLDAGELGAAIGDKGPL